MSSKERKERITIRFPKETIEDLKFVGLLEGCSISFIIRTITQDYINYYLWRNKNSDHPETNEQGNV